MTAVQDPVYAERRKPARGWRGWRGPTEDRPFPSLGWGFLAWTYAYLPDPREEVKPLVFTEEQARRIIRWFELHPVTGEFLHTTMILEEAKGWGKSPFAGALDIGEMAGPVCFDGWDANGEPVGVSWGTGGRPVPWVQIAAVSEDQTDNTYGALYGMLASRNGKVADSIRLDLGRTRVYHRDLPSAVLEPVTASSGSREGQRITKATMDETWLWKPENKGVALARTLRRNVGKMNGRSVETTNAPVLGQRSVAEQSNPDRPGPGVLHYATRPTVKVTPAMSDEQLRAVMADQVYRDCPWAPVDRLVKDIRDPRTPWSESVRFFFNTRGAGSSAAVDPRKWNVQGPPTVPAREVPAGTRIGLGFDGSVSQDSTVLRACTADGYRFSLPGWSWVRPTGEAMARWAAEHPDEDWRVPRDEVDAAVAEAFLRFDVGRFRPDAAFWRDEITRWQRMYGDKVVMPFDTNSARLMSPAFDRWKTAVANGTAPHDGDEVVTAHVLSMHQVHPRNATPDEDGRLPLVPAKGEDKAKIDGGLADILAYDAAMTMPEAEAVGDPEFFAL